MRVRGRCFVLCITFLASAVPLASGAAVTQTNVGGVELIIESSATPAPSRPAARQRHTAPAAAAAEAASANDTDIYARPSGADELVRSALSFVGTPYVWGGASPSGFDCSGFIWYIYKQAGISIPRTADVQFAAGRDVTSDPQPGDLVFFQTYDYGASHVGLYLGNGQFLNAIGANVHVDSFATDYFRSRYIGARRFLPG